MGKNGNIDIKRRFFPLVSMEVYVVFIQAVIFLKLKDWQSDGGIVSSLPFCLKRL